MNNDHHFLIGHDHNVCEDYAISGVTEGNDYAILCDGCSASEDVDVGARLLALAARRTFSLGGFEMSYDTFGKTTIFNIEKSIEYLDLDPQSLDATLLVTWIKNGKFTAYMYGDGVFFHKNALTLDITHVDFESNCPSYLSYYLDKTRMNGYEREIQGSKHILEKSFPLITKENVIEPCCEIQTESYVKPFDFMTITDTIQEGDIVGVISDGINSFRKGDDSPIKWEDMIKEFVDFKTIEGVFVQRRLSALKRKWAKEQINHYDDISMSAICI